MQPINSPALPITRSHAYLFIRCTSFFYVKTHHDSSSIEATLPLEPTSLPPPPPSPPSKISPPATSAPPPLSSPSLTSPPKDNDPLFGKHWPAASPPSVSHALHNTERPESEGVPATKVTVWDLQVDDNFEGEAEGGCKSSELHCVACDKRNILTRRFAPHRLCRSLQFQTGFALRGRLYAAPRRTPLGCGGRIATQRSLYVLGQRLGK